MSDPTTQSEILMESTSKSKSKVKLILSLVVVAALIGTLTYFGPDLRTALEWIKGLGYWAPIMYIGLYILCCIFFIPGSVITIGGGVLFGVVAGSVYVSLASVTGATLAFLIGSSERERPA